MVTKVKPAATDEKCIRWTPDFAGKLTDEEIRFILLHETLHCAHQHLWRLPHDQNGNVAGDYCINRTLAAIEGMSMPKGGLDCPPEFDGLAEEEIYARLPPSEGEENEQGSACGDFTAPADDAEEPGDQPGDGSDGAGDQDSDESGSN